MTTRNNPEWSLTALEEKFPSIRWTDPLMVHWPDGVQFTCRICVSNEGLRKGSWHQWKRYAECVAHITEKHLQPTGGQNERSTASEPARR